MAKVDIELSESSFIKLAERAHELDITINELINKMLKDVISGEVELDDSKQLKNIQEDKQDNVTKPPFRPPMSDNRQDVPIVNKWVDPKYKNTTNSWKF